MDEYKEHLYRRNPNTYAKIDAGDLTAQLEIRERLQCKSFKWFMENIAFDLPSKYPPIEPPNFASGTIKSVAHPHLCADTMGTKRVVGLFSCADNAREPQGSQYFALSWHKDIRLFGSEQCWDVPRNKGNDKVEFYGCHGQQGNQGWKYHMVSDISQMDFYAILSLTLCCFYVFSGYSMVNGGRSRSLLGHGSKYSESIRQYLRFDE